jgi:hypothetical protein
LPSRRIGAVTPFGQVTVSSSISMRKRSLVNVAPTAVGGWVLQRESMPASARWASNSPVP